MARVLCAMSGGVDSSVAAALLSREGHEVVGIFLRLGAGADAPRSSTRACCSVNDAADAARVADRLGVPFYALNHAESFETIIRYFVSEYNRGRTPNPCARCNQWLKFGSLREQANALGCEYLATGHYARITPDTETGEGACLRRGADRDKDQSYFLFGVPAGNLTSTLFPVGDRTKDQIRRLAHELDLPVANKPDSQEICFVPDNDYRAVLRSRTPGAMRPGRLVDTRGETLGEHPGHQNFTIGQRRGIRQAFGHPVYVVAIDAVENLVTLGRREDLETRVFEVDEVNWLTCQRPRTGSTLEVEAQIRHRTNTVSARVHVTGSDTARVELDEPRHAVTPGQAAVFYRGDTVLGGGWIVG